jgi:hypothetical protein
MLHVCVQKFDVTGNLKKIYKILKTKQAQAESLEKGQGKGIDRSTSVQRTTPIR